VTTIGYMPIIQAPAHELDTLNTVVQRFIHVSSSLGQKHVLLTVDQALYFKLMELKWATPQYKHILIPRLGGLHTSMNFLKVIGQHMQASGLSEVWVESGILGPVSTEKALEGKSYTKGMRAHKLTFQAMWQILLPQLLDHLKESDRDLGNEIRTKHGEALITLLATGRFHDAMAEFITHRATDSVNFTYWWNYMEMVVVLLMYTRAQRDGLWNLHLYSFQCMLPFFLCYDHTNYARWGPVYRAEMHQLPGEVLEEFQRGNFVVKGSAQKFNQVSPDMSQEWMNAVGKKGGGIVGITKTSSALSRWVLSYNLRAHIAMNTRSMFNLCLDDQLIHSESTNSRNQRDNADEAAVLAVLQRFHLFSLDSSPTVLQSLANKDLATDDIQQSLLNAKSHGTDLLVSFVEKRLIRTRNIPGPKLRDTLPKNKPLTFAKLYEIDKACRDKTKTLMVTEISFSVW